MRTPDHQRENDDDPPSPYDRVRQALFNGQVLPDAFGKPLFAHEPAHVPDPPPAPQAAAPIPAPAASPWGSGEKMSADEMAELYEAFQAETFKDQEPMAAQLGKITSRVLTLSDALARGPAALEDALASARLPRGYGRMFRTMQQMLEPPATLGDALPMLRELSLGEVRRMDGRFPVPPELHARKVEELCRRRLGHLRNPRFAPVRVELGPGGKNNRVYVPGMAEPIPHLRAYRVQSYGVLLEPETREDKLVLKAHHLYLLTLNILHELQDVLTLELAMGSTVGRYDLAERSHGRNFELLVRDILIEGGMDATEPYVADDLLHASDIVVRTADEAGGQRRTGLQLSLDPTEEAVGEKRDGFARGRFDPPALVTTWTMAQDLLATAEGCAGDREAVAKEALSAVLGPYWHLVLPVDDAERTFLVSRSLRTAFRKAMTAFMRQQRPDARGPLVFVPEPVRAFVRAHVGDALANEQEHERSADDRGLRPEQHSLSFQKHWQLLRRPK